MGAHRYLVALGSNVRHHRHGRPAQVLRAALAAMAEAGLAVERASRIHATAPLGPSRRRFANAAAVLRSGLDPEDMLELLVRIEREFGRRRGGRRWGARVLDLDIVLWDGGAYAAGSLVVPHRQFRSRRFVLRPGAEIAGDWRDPITGLSVRQLLTRLTRQRPPPR